MLKDHLPGILAYTCKTRTISLSCHHITQCPENCSKTKQNKNNTMTVTEASYQQGRVGAKFCGNRMYSSEEVWVSAPRTALDTQ